MSKLFLLLLLFSPLVVFSQDIEEEITVAVRDIRVHVVDKDDKPVTGLTREDFQIKEGKIDRDLSFFEEIDLRTPATPQVPQEPTEVESGSVDLGAEPLDVDVAPNSRAVVLYLDTSNINQNAFEKMIEATIALVRREARENITFKIVHFDKKLTHLSAFSSDPEVLVDSLLRADYSGSFRQRLERLQSAVNAQQDMRNRTVGDSRLNRVREDAELNDWDIMLQDAVWEKERAKMEHFKSYFYNMTAMGQILAGVPGSKAIWLITGGVYLQSGDSRYINTSRWSNNLARALNRYNVTVYSFLQTDKTPLGSDFAETNTNVFADLSATSTLGNTQLENDWQIQTGPEDVTDQTGGFMARAFGPDNLTETLLAFTQKSKHFYRLVYTLSDANAASKVKISFTKKRPGWKIIYGKSFKKPKPYTKFDETDLQISFESTLLYSRTERNDLNCQFRYHRFQDSGTNQILIPVTIDIKTKDIPEKGYEIGLAAYAEKDYLLDVIQTTVTNPPATEGLRFYHVMIAERDPKIVRFYVRDLDTGRFSLNVGQVAEPFEKRYTLALSETILSQPDDYRLIPLNHMEVGKADAPNSKPRKEKDPLLMKDYLVSGQERDVYRTGVPIDIFFRFENIVNDLAKHKVRFYLREGEETKPLGCEIKDIYQASSDTYHYTGRLGTQELPAGDYMLMIQIHDPDSGKAFTRMTPFSLGD